MYTSLAFKQIFEGSMPPAIAEIDRIKQWILEELNDECNSNRTKGTMKMEMSFNHTPLIVYDEVYVD